MKDMVDEMGEGASGYTQYVTLQEFHTMMYGSEGTNGLVKDIHDLKMWIKFLGIIGGFISPVVTALILKYLVGI